MCKYSDFLLTNHPFKERLWNERKIQMEMVLRDIMAVMHMAMFHS